MMNGAIHEPDIIFITGIMPRSGTHFLANLLCLHPNCEGSVIPEDGLVARATMLTSYTNKNYRRWMEEGGLPEIPAREILMECLGEGLATFLKRARKETLNGQAKNAESELKFLVAKSPQVINIGSFFTLFPNKKLLVIVRDGRALVESINTSFGYNRQEAMRDWAEAAGIIADFEDKWKDKKHQYLIVRYEDLHSDTENAVRKILDFMGLDASRYDFKEAKRLPVVGSSVFKRGNGDVHWQPEQKTDAFKPLERAQHWTRKRHERFNWLAGNELLQFGYKPVEFNGFSFFWKTWNYYHDFIATLKQGLIRIVKLFYFIGIRLKKYLIKK